MRKALAIGAVVVAIVVAMFVALYSQKGRKPPRAVDPVERSAQITPDLAKVRGLALKHAIPAQMQTTAEFRSYMERAAAQDPKKLAAATTGLIALGLLPTGVDLGHAIADTLVTQAAAYYDWEAKRFSIVQLPTDPTNRDVLVSHELTHGLQDQHFDLAAFVDAKDLDTDAAIARRFVVEGDAMMASIAFTVFAATGAYELTRDQTRAMRPQLAKFATSDMTSMIAALQAQSADVVAKDPSLKASFDAMGSLPRIVLVPLLASYMHGAMFILDVYEKGGWTSVNALFTDPPQSTEQVLHPERWFSGDRPVRIDIPDVEDSELVVYDVIGELQWSVYFSLWPHTGDKPEINWGGDRYAVWRDKEGDELTVLIVTTWDTAYAAKGFHDAYVSTLEARYKDREYPLVVQRAEDVFIIDGGDQEMMDALVKQTQFDR